MFVYWYPACMKCRSCQDCEGSMAASSYNKAPSFDQTILLKTAILEKDTYDNSMKLSHVQDKDSTVSLTESH